MRTFQILHQSALKTFAPFQENQKSNGRPQELCPAVRKEEPCPTLCNDKLINSAQATLLQESYQFGWNATKATVPGATLLTLTSSSTLDRSRYLRSQISSGYIAIRLERHQDHSARSHAAHLDEFVYSGQVTLLEESDKLMLHCHSAGTPPRPQCQEPRCSP